MFSPLLQSVIARHGYTVVDHDQLDEIAGPVENAVLLFAGDARRLAESDDVAVVLPELVKAFGGAFTPLVVARDSERALQLRYRFNAYPALVFLRRGEYLGAVQRVQDWADYLRQIATILAGAPSEPPPYKFPENCAIGAQSGPH